MSEGAHRPAARLLSIKICESLKYSTRYGNETSQVSHVGEQMKRLGIVLDVSYRGKLVTRAEATPSLGEKVFTSDGQPIGRVERVFGLVSRPYVTVKPTSRKQKLMGVIGKELYLE